VVTYCASGEVRHADEHGKGGILKKGELTVRAEEDSELLLIDVLLI